MKHLVKTLAFLCLFVTTAKAQEFTDVITILPNETHQGEIIGIEKYNNYVFTAGNWTGDYDLNPRGTEAVISSTTQGIFLAHYDANGVMQWGVSIDGTDHDQVNDLAFLETPSLDGSIYISGSFTSSVLSFPDEPNVGPTPPPFPSHLL